MTQVASTDVRDRRGRAGAHLRFCEQMSKVASTAIIFRANATLYHYYYFRVCQDGTYALWRYDHSGPQSKSLLQGSNPNIVQGTGQPNLLAVVANNSSISLYVNHQFINSIQDSMYTQGQIGVAADNNTQPTEVVFQNAKVWTF
jgi:hypothetical protein